jgi:DNA-binding HxlR family transcriptional regulator
MDSGANSIPADALEDIAYLSRSSNRANILDRLSRAAHTRRELTEHVAASRTTLDWIVNELKDRGWVERTTDGDYVATSAGTPLIREFRPCVESAEAIRRLGPAIDWLPVDELEIGLRHFRDATVRWPEGDDPAETVDFMNRLMSEASDFQVLTHLKPPPSLLQVTRDAVMSGRLSVKAVGTDSYSDGPLIQQSDRRDLWRDILEAGAQLYRYDGPIPCNLWIFDELVLIKKSRPGPIDESYGVPIVSENSAVRSWAEDLIDRYIADAERLDEISFLEPSVTSGES